MLEVLERVYNKGGQTLYIKLIIFLLRLLNNKLVTQGSRDVRCRRRSAQERESRRRRREHGAGAVL